MRTASTVKELIEGRGFRMADSNTSQKESQNTGIQSEADKCTATNQTSKPEIIPYSPVQYKHK
jgi:hypothetical protein